MSDFGRKLTAEDVAAIRAAWAAGAKQYVLAREFGVDRTTVCKIVSNRIWHDPAWSPVREGRCELPECGAVFHRQYASRRFCCKAHMKKHSKRLRRGYYLRQAERAAAARRLGVGQPGRAIAAAAALEAPIGHGPGAAQLRDVIADPAAVDPVAAFEAAELRALLPDDVAGLTERELAALRARLARAGYRPAVSRAA